MKNTTLKRRYIEHRANAQGRGIPFLLTFEQWEWIWVESGKLAQRGSRKGQYVMARPGDKGAYEVGNVIICLAEENRAERNKNYPLKGGNGTSFGTAYWAAESRKKILHEAGDLGRAVRSGRVVGYIRNKDKRRENYIGTALRS